MFVFLFVFVFLLNLLTAGLLPHFPLFPIPLPKPRFFDLSIPPLFNVPLFAPEETWLIFCSVFFLQCGQYLFVFLGNFIKKVAFAGLKMFLYCGCAVN